VDSLTKEEIIQIVKDNGIVGLGGAAFPSHVKLKPPKEIDTFIVNGCECEPYLTTDYRLMLENLDKVLKGIEVVCKVIAPKEVIFAVESNPGSVNCDCD